MAKRDFHKKYVYLKYEYIKDYVIKSTKSITVIVKRILCVRFRYNIIIFSYNK